MTPRPERAGGGGTGGFSLVEVMIATGLLATAVASLAHMFAVATQANLEARRATYATILAAQKLEELLATAALAGDGKDQVGVYASRWSIEPLPADPDHSAVIQVLVTPGAGRLVTIQTRTAP